MTSNKKQSLDLITVLGPTASGKTQLAVQLAHKLNGEIISADSRQIYRGMDIGTGKDLDEYTIDNIQIPYHLIDILDPTEDYSVYQFQQDFHDSVEKIKLNGRQPILCGGTGLYLDSVLLDYKFEPILADNQLRDDLEKRSKEELLIFFENIDARLYSEWPLDTKRRIIRGIELALADGTPETNSQPHDLSRTCIIGIQSTREIIRQRITQRLQQRIDGGMIEEVESLISNGLPKERLNYFGLEYKFVHRYLDGELSKSEMFELLNIAIHQFAKRQRSWFRRMEKRGIKIHWVDNGSVEYSLKIIQSYN